MKIGKITERVALAEGVTASYADRTFVVKGPKGELQRRLYHPAIAIATDGGVTLSCTNATMREKKQLYSFRAHVRNMLKGVTDGFTYRLKVCSGHFPMSVAVKDGTLEVKNFIGEKVPRVLRIKAGAEVKLDGETLTVEGIDKEIVGQVAADIEQLTKRPGFDSRVFQDGIFIVEKDGKVMG